MTRRTLIGGLSVPDYPDDGPYISATSADQGAPTADGAPIFADRRHLRQRKASAAAGRRLLGLVLRPVQWCCATWDEGPVSYYLGGLAAVLGRYDEADAYFAKSAALSHRMGAKFYAASTDLSWGKMLAERKAPGDADKARDLLTVARSAEATHGYANVERRAAEVLQRLN